MERQSSMASSTEEMSASGGNDLSSGSGARGIDAAAAAADQFGVFRDFDFLEYESESVEVAIIISLFFIFNIIFFL